MSAELPVSRRPSKERRYRIADPYLRFWLDFVDPYMAEIERLRGDLTLARIKFDAHDLAALQKHRAAMTDEPIPLVAVSRAGVSCQGLQATFGPAELLAAW